MRAMMVSAMTVILCGTLSGCGAFFPEARDITDVQLMRTMALDVGEEGKIAVTMASGVRPADKGGNPQPPIVLNWEAPTIFQACLKIQTFGDGYIALGHTEQCVVSADLAKQSTVSLLDFVQRDFEMRTSIDLFVTEGKAADILTETASETQSATDRLQSISRDMQLESSGWTVTVREFLMDSADNGTALVPVVELAEEEDTVTIRCSRMGWFQEQCYGGMLSEDESRAAAILSNKTGSGAVEVTLSNGGRAGLRLTGAQCKWKQQWDGDKLVGLVAEVHAAADLAEIHGEVNVLSAAVQQELQNELSQQLQRQIMQLLRRSQREKADFLHLRRTAELQRPSKYRMMRANWETWFDSMTLSAEVQSVIERSYDTNEGETTK